MENKNTLRFFITFIILRSLGILVISAVLFFFFEYIFRYSAGLLIAILAIGLFAGWLTVSAMKRFEMSSKQMIFGGVLIPALTLLRIFLNGFFLIVIYYIQFNQKYSSALNSTTELIPITSSLLTVNLASVVAATILFYVGFNVPIIYSLLKKKEPISWGWYALAVPILIVLFFTAVLITVLFIKAVLTSLY